MEKNDRKKGRRREDSFLVAYGVYGAVGIQLVLSVVIGLYLGSVADRHFHTAPWFSILGILLGGGAGFYNLFRMVTKKHESGR